MPPNWKEDIKPLFTQYDAIQMSYYCDLSRYEDVKKYAEAILLCVQPHTDPDMAKVGWSRLPNVHLMPKYGERWSDKKVATFKDWIAANFPRGEPEPAEVRE